MRETDVYNTMEKNFVNGKECRYCRVFQKQGPQVCKYCIVYGHRFKHVLGSAIEQKSSSVGEYLPAFDFNTQEIIKLYRKAGSNWEQIENILYDIIKEDIRIVTNLEKGRR